MTAPIMPGNGDTQPLPKVYAGQLWAGGVATAVVAALVALVGILVCRWLFSIPILAPRQDGAYGDVATTGRIPNRLRCPQSTTASREIAGI